MLTVVVSLILTLYLVLREPTVQTLAARMAADWLSRELHTTVRIGGFGLSIRNGLVLEKILVKDNRDTTLFAARELGVKPVWFSMAGRNIVVQKLFISQGEFQLLTHRGDSVLNLQFIINHFTSADTVVKKVDTIPALPWTISCYQLDLNGIRFHFQDANKPAVAEGMDYANIDVRNIDLHISNVLIKGDTIQASINSLSARERCGLNLLEFHGNCRVSGRFIEVMDLNLKTDHSDLSLDFAFRYRSFNAFTDFLKLVTIEADIQPSDFDMTDVGFFAPDVKAMTNRFRLDGDVNGTVSKFHARNFRVAFGEQTLFNGDIFAVGLPDIFSTYVDMKINNLTTTTEDIRSFRIPGDPDTLAIPGLIATLGLIQVKGEFTGFINDFISRADVQTGLGNVQTNLQLTHVREGGPLAYKGEFRISSFDLGKLTGEEPLLGKVTLRANLDGQGVSLNEADLLMQVRIDSAFLNHYNYKQVAVNGSMIRKKFFGDLTVSDPNLQFTFHGMADFGDTLPVFNFKAWIDHAQLYNLGFLKRDSVEIFSGVITADFQGSTVDNASGTLNLNDLSYWEGPKRAVIDSLLVQTGYDKAGRKSYEVRSDLLDADFTGEFAFSKLVPSLVTFIRNYLASFEMRFDSTRDYHYSGQELDYRIRFKRTSDVTAIFLPFLKITPGSFLEGNYSEAKKILSLNGESPLLQVAGISLEQWYIDAETRTHELSIHTGCDKLVMDKSDEEDTIYIQLDTLQLIATIRQDSILYNLNSSSGKDHSFLQGFLAFLEGGSIKIKLTDLDLRLAGNPWTISCDNFALLDTSVIELHDVTFTSGDQLLSLNGRISHDPKDTLALNFRGVNVSEADYFFGTPTIDIDGILSGNLKINDVYNELSVYSDLRLDHFSFNKQHLGDAVLKVDYNRSEDKFDVLSEIIYTGNIGQNIPFSLAGSYFTAKPDPHFDFTLKLKNLDLRMLEPFVAGFMSKLTGLVSGEVKITGNLEEPTMRGELKLMRTEFNISYLNVPYSVADVIAVEPDRLAFNNIVLYDSLGNKAYLNGSINHRYFKDLSLNLNIRMDDFSAFRNSYSQNSIFYGKARASGTVNITGPLDNIKVVVNAKTGSRTDVTIPISLTQDVGQVDYIMFVQPTGDSLDSIPKRAVLRKATGLTLAMSLDVQPDAQVQVLFPDQLGNIKATGFGDLSLGMTPTTPFNLHGRYSINNGSFLFQMRNLIRLPFAIKEGSSISWTGDPTDANISLSAIYKTKVSIAGLSAETSTVQGRIPVECIIRLNGKLMNPIMSFGLALPNAQESERSLVFNAIDTNNTAEMTQQVLYILVMNQFKPVAGGSAPTVDVGSASLSIITNQISSWLSGMSHNLNIGVNYKPGSSTASQEIDMTLSTQLFNDRLLIDGTFGMSSYSNTSAAQASTIVGDINIEYILTRNRRWRIRAFNRTNTIDILNNNAPYTQGVGISYQRDFSTWKELFTKSSSK
ncbi:MAG: translocation/assembly module TamB [Bacteroidetes bacterium]|nr:MAG: translocation/assembly module TamB [Bacteroidota bacterium]